MLERSRGAYPKGRGVDVMIFSCASRFRRPSRRRRKNPRIAKTTTARPPIIPPTIAPTGKPFGVEVVETEFPVEVENEDKDVVVPVDVVVDDDDVPFWIMR